MLDERAITTAEALRRDMAEREHERLRRSVERRRREEAARRERLRRFLLDRLTRADFRAMRRRVLAAARDGAFETELMRFPSTLCIDDGRAVNNGLPGWEASLPGKARRAHAIWRRVERRKGFRLSARILDYPGGEPGDVGLFLSWAPPATTRGQ